MSSTTEISVQHGARSPDPSLGQTLASVAGHWRTGAALLLLAILQQSLGHHNADNAWLMTVAERLLDGERIYADIIETNPPASFLIYVPAVFLARLLYLPVELATPALVFAAALGTIFLGSRIARKAGLLNGDSQRLAVNAGIFTLLTIPGICFAQREHVALVLLAPVLFVYAARAENAPVTPLCAALAGLMAGAGVCIKPYFALVMALPFFYAIWRRRNVMIGFHAENILAAAIAGLYLKSVPYFFPDFFAILPALLDTYIKVTNPLHLMLTDVFFLFSAALLGVLAAIGIRRRLNTLAATLTAGAAGFTIAALIQGKGWLNHYQPGLSLAVLALAIATGPGIAALAGGRAAQLKQVGWSILRYPAMFALVPSVLLLPMLYGAPNQFAMQEEYPGLKQAVRRHAPDNPKVMAISVGLDVAFPLVRQVKGRWVGQTNILRLMGYARILLDKGRGEPEKMRAYIDADARMFARNVRNNKPDVILVASGPHIEKIRRHQAIRSALSH